MNPETVNPELNTPAEVKFNDPPIPTFPVLLRVETPVCPATVIPEENTPAEVTDRDAPTPVLPEKLAVPTTSNVLVGLEVPIPSLLLELSK